MGSEQGGNRQSLFLFSPQIYKTRVFDFVFSLPWKFRAHSITISKVGRLMITLSRTSDKIVFVIAIRL